MDLFNENVQKGKELLSEAEAKKSLNLLQKKIDARVKKENQRKNFKVYGTLFIGLLLLLTCFFFSSRSIPSFENYYAAIPVFESPIKRTNQEKISPTDKFYLYYNMQNYNSCLKNFELIPKPKFKDSLYLSISYFKTDNSNEAINILNKLNSTSPQIIEIILWYKALSHTKLKNWEMAKSIFKKIVKMDGDFKIKSLEILSKIS